MIDVRWASQLPYDLAWAWQKELVAERIAAPDLPDRLLLVEHPPTYTLGRNGRIENLLLDQAELAGHGFAYYHVDRGGDITYHGPGQLVAYPILNLQRLYKNLGPRPVRRYMSDLEESIIRTLAHFGLSGLRHEEHRGVWIETASGLFKIAAVGVRISRKSISSHGLALNVAPDLTHFSHIIPCGIGELGVTSMAEQLQQTITIDQVRPVLVKMFAEIFQVKLGSTIQIDLAELEGRFLVEAS